MSNEPTPRTDAIRKRIPEPRAIQDMICLAFDLERELTEVTKQRDALAEALEQLIKYQPRSTVVTMNAHHVWRDAREALQSLTPKP